MPAEHQSPACAHARSCPITETACPGECVFAEVMQSVNMGVAIFDLAAPRLIFLNRAAQFFFEQAHLRPEFEVLRGLMFPPGVPLESLPSEYFGPPLNLDSRLIGFTLYRSKSTAWAFFRDITEKARLESIAEAVESMNTLGSIFSAVRHELGNPVNSVKAALSVLRANLDTFSTPVVKEYLEHLSNEMSRVEVLLRSLRSFSMYEQPESTAVDLRTFFATVANLSRADLERRGVRLTQDVEPGLVAHADARALQQALLNLLANAGDALEGREQATITLSARRVEALVQLTVADNGVGMSAEQVQAAFKPFHTTKPQGTGLGLVITRKLLTKMGGTVSLASQRGVGTTVTLRLPAQAAAEARS